MQHTENTQEKVLGYETRERDLSLWLDRDLELYEVRQGKERIFTSKDYLQARDLFSALIEGN
jgi:hypothetical protein